MDFATMLDAGSTKCGGQKQLAALLGVHANNITNAKRGDRGIPDIACVKLAEIIGLPWSQVTAARNEWLAKDDDEKRFWHPFVIGKAASIILTTALLGTSALSTDAQANQALKMPLASRIYIM